MGEPIMSSKLSIATLPLSRNHVITARAATRTGNNRCLVQLLTMSHDDSQTGVPNTMYRTNENRKIVTTGALLANSSRTLYGTNSCKLIKETKVATIISSIKTETTVLRSISRFFI
jgi:hypothetical protein